MNRSGIRRWSLVVAMGLLAPVAAAIDLPPRVAASDLYRGKQLKLYPVTTDLALARFGRPWKFSKTDRCNFTYFSPEAKDVSCSSEGLRFRMAGEKVVVGWGNYDNRQAQADRVTLFSGWNDVELKVRQSAASSVWTLDLWANGSPKPGRYSHERIAFWAKPRAQATVKGLGWQTVRFHAYRAGPDGFGLAIRGPAGNIVEIASVRITQTLARGCFRKEFRLPAGVIWRAVAEVSHRAALFVNGQPVRVADVFAQTAPVDLAPYLKPGRQNVVCLSAQQTMADRNEPFVYLHGKAIMADGSVVSLDSDATWRGRGQAPKGWTAPEFAASGWEPAKVAAPYLGYAIRRWPAYDGRLLLENPGRDPKLYFDAAKPVRVNVRAPEGLGSPRPTIQWVLRRVERENVRPEVRRGAAAQFQAQPQTHSLVFPLDLGRLDLGLYTIELAMTRNGEEIERRFEEPFIVVGRLPMKEVAGDSYTQGMKLELEDVIDFTDPADPHPWVEARAHMQPYTKPAEGIDTPKIVRKTGRIYREVTDPRARSLFSYRFEFKHPFSWYLMVLEYPNDAERWIGVSVTSAARDPRERRPALFQTRFSNCYNSQDGPSVVTGGKYPLDGKMHELRWLHWADPETQTLDIVNLKPDLPAAAARVRIYHVTELPAIKIHASGERFFGIHTERARSLGRTFSDNDGLDPYQIRYDKLGYDMVARFTQRLRWHFDACRNYTAYLRFTGQNLHVMGSFQYSEVNTPYSPPERAPGDGRLLQDIRETALRFFEHNGITMYSMVEYVGHKSLRAQYAVSDAEVARGADTLSFVSKDGKQGGWKANPNHPAVEAGYLRVIDDLATKFAFSPAWKGIYYFVYVDRGGFGPAPLAPHAAPFDYDYSDATIAAFERDTGIKVPGAPRDPERFKKRYLFLTSDAMRGQWTDWRCRKTGTYITKTLKLLHKHRSDLNVLYGYHLVGGTLRYWLSESGQSYRDYFRQMGMDPRVARGEPHAWFGRYLYPTGPHSQGKPDYWPQAVNPEAIAYYDNPRNRLVALDTCWHELPTSAPGWFAGKGGIENMKPPDWPMPHNNGRFISQAEGDNALECYTQALIGADPDILVFGMTDVNIINSREQQVRQVAKVIAALPKDKFQPVAGTTDFRHNLAIRSLTKDGATWFTVANPGYWPIRGGVVLSGAARVATPGNGRIVRTRSEGGNTVVPVALGPFGMAAFRADRPAKILRWGNEPLADRDLAHMRGIMAEMKALLAEPRAALGVTLKDREFIRSILKRAATQLKAGEYAAAWSELTHWRLWTLRAIMKQAKAFSARLPGRPPIELNPAARPRLKAARIGGGGSRMRQHVGTLAAPIVSRSLAAAATAPAIDGRLDDPAWGRAQASFRFLAIGRGAAFKGMPLVDTAVQACYDDRALYLALRMADPDVAARRRSASQKHPIQILRQYDDAALIFLCPPEAPVKQFGVNAGGVKYFAASGEWGVTESDLVKRPWAAAVAVRPGEWDVEAALPFESLAVAPPRPGQTWRANFLRRFRNFQVPECYWARIQRGWGDVEHYGVIEFE